MTHSGETDWLHALEASIFPNIDNAGSSGCAVLGQKCDPGQPGWQCGDYFDKEPDKYEWKEAYWVFRAVKGVQKSMERMKRELGEATSINGLKVDQMIDDFQADKEKTVGATATQVLNWFSTAIISVGVVGGLIGGPLAATLTTGGVAIGIIAGRVAGELDKDDAELPLKAIKNALADFSKDTSKHLDITIRLAMGNKVEGAEFDELPSLTHVTTEKDFAAQHSVSKFYSSPYWLLDIDSMGVEKISELVSSSLRWKLIDTIMQSVEWYIMGDDEIKDQGACEEAQGQWMDVDGTFYCLSMWWYDSPIMKWKPAAKDTTVYSAMKTHEMLDIQEYFRQCLRCAKSGNAGTVVPQDVKDIVSTELPECYLSMPVKWRVKKELTLEECVSQGVSCLPKDEVTDWYA